jgi:uncharacterized membrane protein
VPSYNRIAGESVERLAALSDGIFAVARTLLVLDLHGPVKEAVHTEHDLWRALGAISPQLLTYPALLTGCCESVWRVWVA